MTDYVLDHPVSTWLAEDCADPTWWTQTIAFTTVRARRAA